MSTPGEHQHAQLDDGWLLPEPEARQPIHTRSILCRSFRRDDGLIDLDGRFIDTRPFGYTNEFRGAVPAGAMLHNMQLRLTLDSHRTIVAVRAVMPNTPYTGCPDITPNFQRLVGLGIGRGFKAALRERLGGLEGCTHVLALLEMLGASAMQAFASNNYAPRAADAPAPARVWRIEALEGTCHSYHPDGPVVAKLRAMQAGAAGQR